MNYASSIAEQLNIQSQQVQSAINLLDEGNTIPFIARYRKEVTGVLDEEQLRNIQELLEKLRSLDERRTTILASIDAQGKMTDELRQQINEAATMTALEDLYAPYKPKRRTRAMIAREKGLQGLADMILAQQRDDFPAEDSALSFLSDVVLTVEDALAGARDIVAEQISEHAEVRSQVRERAFRWGNLQCEKIDGANDEKRMYELYYAFDMRIDRLRPHQVLAINRGEEEKILRVGVVVPERDWQGVMQTHFRTNRYSPFAEQLQLAQADCAERLLLPAIERDVRRDLTQRASTHAIAVFSNNLRALLLQPPISGQVILGVDPGFRTGCKLAVVDPTGKVLATGTIYPHEPQKRWREALEALSKWVKQYGITLLSIGNGTASRETEQLAAELVKLHPELRYLIANEAGASVYSASPLARNELPDLDVSIRGAVSIARRVQDGLAELVKIDPKSIGVGMYQHDVDQTELSQALHAVVESVVNQVGVDVNTASPALLTNVAGIGPKLAEKVVTYRDEHGPFKSRDEIKKVPGLGPKAFEQSAGFLRVNGGSNPLDATAIHPESYPVAEAIINRYGISRSSLTNQIEKMLVREAVEMMAKELGVGAPTLSDILEQLARPGRDPRLDMPAPILRSDVLGMDDLVVGMRMKGTVRNVIDFGSFVDIGVKQDGLLHRSQLPQGTAIQPGDVIDVEILSVDKERGRIGLKWAGN